MGLLAELRKFMVAKLKLKAMSGTNLKNGVPMSPKFSLSLLFALPLLACSGSDTDDAVDSGTDTDTAPEDVLVTFDFNISNCNTGVAVEGLELCDLMPEFEEDTCATSDSNGLAQITWTNPPVSSNYLTLGSHPNYADALIVGHYTEANYEFWLDAMAAGDSLDVNFCFFLDQDTDAFFSGGGLVREEGMGHVWYGLYSNEGYDVSGAVVELHNAEGELAATSYYQGGVTGEINVDLTETSGRGAVLFPNVAPGEYTVKVTHETLNCVSEGWSFLETDTNAFPVPVQAGAVTNGFVGCSLK